MSVKVSYHVVAAPDRNSGNVSFVYPVDQPHQLGVCLELVCPLPTVVFAVELRRAQAGR